MIDTPVILRTVSALANEIIDSGFALLKAGQRSGKTFIAFRVISKLYDLLHNRAPRAVIFVGPSAQFAESALHKSAGFEDLPAVVRVNSYFIGFDDVAAALSELEQKYADGQFLFVFDEVFWYDAYKTVKALHGNSRCLVYAYGSRGPFFDNTPEWPTTFGLSFATWELNPAITQLDLREHLNFSDPKVQRDYMAF